MKTKVFLSGNTVATAVVDIELVEGFFVRKVYVYWNFATAHNPGDIDFGDPNQDIILNQIRNWCEKKKYNLWSY